MTQITFIADVHVANHKAHGGVAIDGVNDRCARVLDCITQVARTCTEETLLVVLGDLFDVDKPSPAIIDRTSRALRAGKARVVALVGNHDQTTAPNAELGGHGEHALLPLRSKQISVIERPSLVAYGDVDLLCVPFSPTVTPATLEATVRDLLVGQENGRTRVLCIHLGIWDAKTPPWLIGAHDAIAESDLRDIARTYRISYVEAGNWHDQRTWPPQNGDGVRISQVGALCPTGWDNPGLSGYGGVEFIETLSPSDKGSWGHTWIHGPRFIAFGRKGEPTAESFEKTLSAIKPVKCHDDALRRHSIYARLYVKASELAAASARVKAAIDAGWLVGGEALVADAAETRAATSSAAIEALKQGFNHDEAIARYVAAKEYPAGVTAERVLAKVKGYIQGGTP